MRSSWRNSPGQSEKWPRPERERRRSRDSDEPHAEPIAGHVLITEGLRRFQRGVGFDVRRDGALQIRDRVGGHPFERASEALAKRLQRLASRLLLDTPRGGRARVAGRDLGLYALQLSVLFRTPHREGRDGGIARRR